MTEKVAFATHHRNLWRDRPSVPTSHDRSSRHSLHTIVTRICTLPPRLARYLIENFSAPGDIVFDPFCGKGTVPLEACLNRRIGIGTDISPEAVCATKAAVRAPRLPQIQRYIAKNAVLAAELEENISTTKEFVAIPPDLSQFFHPETLRGILAWRSLLRRKNSNSAAFVRGLLLGILHGKGSYFLSLRCSHSYSMSPRYVRNYVAAHKLTRPRRNVSQCLLERARHVLRDGPASVKGLARIEDARSLTLKGQSVNLILTSPPYFSVHRYARDNWIRLWFLDHADYRSVQRKLIQTQSVPRYRAEMRKSLSEMMRVLVPGGSALILVGDVRIRRKREPLVKTAFLLREDAIDLGFECEAVLKDRIPAKFKVAGYMAVKGGIKTERLLVIRRPS